MVARVTESEIEQAGGLKEFARTQIETTSNGTMEMKERAAALLHQLADQSSLNVQAIRQLNVVQPLVALLVVGSSIAQQRAAGALAAVMRGSKDLQTAVMDAGAVLPLATILRSSGGDAQEQAAAALASISELPETHKSIIKANAVGTLIELLRKSSSATQVNASQAVANLCTGNAEAQAEVQKHGGVRCLLSLLGSGKAQEHAARALAKVCHMNGVMQAEVCKAGGISALLAMLSDRNVEAQIQAAAALAELAQGEDGLGHRRTQNAISKAGGIGPLLAMVEATPVVHRAVAESVHALAQVARRNRANQDTIAVMGGIRPIVELLQQGSNPDFVQKNAALALAEICRRNEDNQNAIADIGGIGQLVVLLRHSGKPAVEAEVAGALWTISVNNVANKVSIAAAGAIPTICQLLGSSSERAQSHAGSALASLAFDNVENQKQESPILVGLLGSTNETTQKRAARALWRMVKENPESQTEIAKAGGADALVKLLRDGSPGARKYALWSLSLSIDKDNQSTVSETGGVKPLVSSLSSNNVTVTEQAAAALAKLATSNKDTQKEIAAAGGIAPLIDLLDRGASEKSQECAAAALAELALLIANKTAIDRAGGIAPLVSLLLYDGAFSSKKYAACALARMATDGHVTAAQLQTAAKEAEENGRHESSGEKRQTTKSEQIAQAGAITPLVTLLNGERGADAQEEAAGALLALAAESSNRMAITEAGGIGPLVLLLGCDNQTAREHAEGALVRLSIENANRVLIIKQLVGMLHDSGTAAQEQAAAALANLARDSTDNRTSIVDAGGIPPLLALLDSDSHGAKENSAAALTQLCATRANQDAIAKVGGIPLLVGVLQSSVSSKEASATTLCSLAAMAIWQLSKKNPANQLAIAEAGSITPLVTMLGSPTPEMQSNAAGALSCLSRDNHDNQNAIARTGAIAPLCTLVREGTPETKETCASALWSLSTDNAQNKATIAKLGGIEPLVGLLVGGTTDKSQAYAAGALASLASKHTENRSAIAKRLIGLLNGRAVERAVRVLHALSELSYDNAANQVAIAKTGGIVPVIGWLGNAAEEAQREAAHAILSIASNNATTQAIIAKSGGIQPLIELVDKSSVEAQEYAARALWHLGSIPEHQVAIAEAGGIPPLVAMLSAESEKAPELAALTLVRLADSNPQVADSISHVGGIVPLVKLLSSGSPEAQQQSAAAISELALVDQHRDAIAHAGGIEPLIKLLGSQQSGTPEIAARALSHLARNCTGEGQKEEENCDSSDEDDEPVEETAPAADAGRPLAPILGGPARRLMIHRFGGISKLITMLHDSDTHSKYKNAPWTKAAVSGQVAADEQKGSNSLGKQAQAAAALCDLAIGDPHMQDAIISAGGVQPLLSLIRSSSTHGQEHAARAIWSLCESVENQHEIVEKGCVNDLVSLMKNGSVSAQEVAAAGIAELAHGAIIQRTRRQEELQKATEERAADKAASEAMKEKAKAENKAISTLHTTTIADPTRAGDPSAARSISIAASGSAPAIPGGDRTIMSASEVRATSPVVSSSHQSDASSMHGSDVEDDGEEDRLKLIVEAGAIAPLVALLSNGSDLAKEKAAASLWHLAFNPPNQTAIAKANGIPPIVLLLDDATYQASHYAACALARLSQESSDMQAQIAKRLVQLLSADNTGAQERAAHALCELAKDQPSSPVVIVNAGAISPLVNLLSHGTLRAKKESADALACLAKNNPKNQLAISIGLTALLGGGEVESQEHVTKLLLELATDRGCRAAISEAGAIQKLVSQLKSSSVPVQEYAAAVLSHLTADNEDNVAECANHGSIKPLVQLLGSESVAAQAHAAKVISEMTRTSKENRFSVCHEGGIAPLVAILGRKKHEDTKAEAAGALWSLAQGGEETQATVADADAIIPLVQLLGAKRPNAQIKASGALAALANNSTANQDAITSAGGIDPLVGLLNTARSTVVQEHAANALAELTRDHAGNQGSIAEAGAIDPLINMLKVESDDQAVLHAKEAAAGALWKLSSQNFAIQTSVAKAGGITPLAALLGSGSSTAQKQAAGALGSLALDNEENEQAISTMIIELLISSTGDDVPLGSAEKAARAVSRLARAHPSNQVALARAGGIDQLISMVDDGEKSKSWRKCCHEKLLQQCIEQGNDPSSVPNPTVQGTVWCASAQKEIAGALWALADNNYENQRAIADAGGVPLLIAMVSRDGVVQRNAAGALWSLAQDRSNQILIAEMNGIGPIVELLSKGNSRAQETAAGALHSLSSLESNRTAIANVNGIEPLVALFDGGSDAATEQAMGALSTLVVNNDDNQDKVATGLITLLSTGSDQAQARVTVLVRNLSQDPENRGSLAKAGAVPQLVRKLQDGSDETQSLAANALSQIAKKSSMHRVQVTQQLVGLLGSDSEEVRKRAGIALRDMAAEGGDESQKMVAMAGGVGPLVSLLKDGLRDGRVEAQEYALWSLSLATDANSRATIVQEGCIGPLVTSLRSGLLSATACEHAAAVLSALARTSDNTAEMISSGAIPPLVKLLSEDHLGARKHAANAIARLASTSFDTQIEIARAGAIEALALWLNNDGIGPGMPELAARALSDIAADNAKTSAGIVRADAIPALVCMLGAGKGNDAQRSAAGCLATLANVELPPLHAPPKAKQPKEEGSGDQEASSDPDDEPAPPPEPRYAPIAQMGGIPLLVELLKAERVGPHENATRALWRLAGIGDNKLEIAEVGGIHPLVHMLTVGTEATQRHAAGCIHSLARKCTENQLRLAKAKAIDPLVALLSSENQETQESAAGALLWLALHVESRNAVVKRLVAVLNARNASAQMKAASTLAVLSSRNTDNRSAIMRAGAIPPLVALLGDGLRVENETPQERAACVLSDLARSSESKEEMVECGGIMPLVRMLSSASSKAQTAAAQTLCHLCSNGDNKISIAQAGGIPRLVALLVTENLDGQAHAAAALKLLATSGENKVEIIGAGGISSLVQMMVNAKNISADALESAAAVLSEIARTQYPNKLAIVEAGGIDPLVAAASTGSQGARRCSAATLWGLAQSAEFKKPIVEAGAIPPLVSLLLNPGEAQSYAVATLNMLAEVGEAKKNIFTNNGVEPLMEIATNAQGNWLRGQAVQLLDALGIGDPLAETNVGFDPSRLPPHTPRGGAMSARGPIKDKLDPQEDKKPGDEVSESVLVAGADPPDTKEALMIAAVGMLMEVSGSRPLQLRAKFEISSDRAGELQLGTPVHILEQKMTDDGKTRMAVSLDGELQILGWLTGSSADGKKNLKEVGRPLLQVTATKPLVARASCDLASDKAGELQPEAFLHILEYQKMPDGAYRIGYCAGGKDSIQGWVTGIAKDGTANVEMVSERRANAGSMDDDSTSMDSPTAPSSPKHKSSTVPKATALPEQKLRVEANQIEELPVPPVTGRKERDDWSPAGRRDDGSASVRNTPPTAGPKPIAACSGDVSSSVAAAAPSNAESSGADTGVAPLPSGRRKSSGSAFAAPLTARRSSSDAMMGNAPLTARRASSDATATTAQPLTARRSSTEQVSDGPLPSGRRPKSVTVADAPATEAPQASGRRGSTTANGAGAGTCTGVGAGDGTGVGSLHPVLLVRTKLKMRKDCDLDSAQAGDVREGTRVNVVAQRELSDGTARACIALAGESTPLGWVSLCAKDGRANLLDELGHDFVASAVTPTGSASHASAPVPAGAPLSGSAAPKCAERGSFAPSKSPFGNSISQGKLPMLATDKAMLLGGGASLPTARSAAKASAAAGVAKAALPPAAVAAAAAAARETVAAQAAAAQAAALAARTSKTSLKEASPSVTSPTKLPSPRQRSFHATGNGSPKGSSSPRASSPRGPASARSTPGTPGRSPASQSRPMTPGRGTGSTTPGRSAPPTPGRERSAFGVPRRNEKIVSHPSQSR